MISGKSGFRLALAAGFVLAAAAATAAPALAAGLTPTGAIQVGGSPVAIAVDPLTSAVYTANSAGNSVTAIDGRTKRVTATIGVGRQPEGVAVNMPALPARGMLSGTERIRSGQEVSI